MKPSSAAASWEEDEDWGWRMAGSDGEGDADGAEVVRHAGGPIVCEQRGNVKRLRIDDSPAATVRLPQYRITACCCVCGRPHTTAGTLASLYDNAGFASLSELMEDVLGLVFEQSANRHENLLCSSCRGHLLALHTMRSWLMALQKRYVRMVVRTNAGRRSAKVMMPKHYKAVDFFRLRGQCPSVPGNEVVLQDRYNAVTNSTMGEGGAGQMTVERDVPRPGHKPSVADNVIGAGSASVGHSVTNAAESPQEHGGAPASVLECSPSQSHPQSSPGPPRSQPTAEEPTQASREARQRVDTTEGKSELFDEMSISDLLVLRPPHPEKPSSNRPVRIAPKMAQNQHPVIPQPPPPIVLNILPVPSLACHAASVTAVSAAHPGLKTIAARDGAPPPCEHNKQPERRSATAEPERPSKSCRQEAPAEPATEGIAYTSMMFYNADGSIPAPQGEPSQADADYPQLRVLELAASQLRGEQAIGRPMEVPSQIQQLHAVCDDRPAADTAPLPSAAAGQGSSSTSSNQGTGEKDTETGSSHDLQLVPSSCKLCFATLGPAEMTTVRKHFVNCHMDLTRNNLKGSTVYCCRGCKLESSSLERLAKHFDTRHVSRSAFVCDTCGWRFSRPEMLRAHLRHTHKPAGKLVCELCGAVYLTARTMAGHMNRVHPSPVRQER